MSETPEARGWAAIDELLDRHYVGQEPTHYGTLLPYELGGPDPLRGISAYRVDEPCPHWHFITFGFSELFEKESDDPSVSGYGFELTFRLAREPEEDVPWFALNFLENLARYVFETGNCFAAGHHMPLNGPIEMGSDTKIWAAAFIRDPQLGVLDGPNGRVEFLQVVGLTLDELDMIVGWSTTRFLEFAAAEWPLFVTDIRRESLLQRQSFADNVRGAIAKEGSSCERLMIEPLGYHVVGVLRKRVRIVIGAFSVRSVKWALLGRLGHERSLVLAGQDAVVAFEPGMLPRWYTRSDQLVVELPRDGARALAERLRDTPGEYDVPGLPSVSIVVEHVHIEDANP